MTKRALPLSDELIAAQLEAEFWRMMYRASRNEWKKWKVSSMCKDKIIKFLGEEITRSNTGKRSLEK